MATSLYSRYIPPKPIRASENSSTSQTNEKQQVKTEEKKRKSEKKSKDGEKRAKRPKISVPIEETSEEHVSKRDEVILAKFEKSSKIAFAARQKRASIPLEPKPDEEEEPVLHGLIPLPQPSPVPEKEYRPTFSALPSWLTKPIAVDHNASTPFKNLGLSNRVVDNLEKKGYRDAIAVQSALLPLLLPGPRRYNGDICVSAPTGSGKTLAYMLPLVESLKQKFVTRLRAIVVVPTRELVSQARQVAELCVSGTGITIGTAVGNIPLSTEQKLLIKRGRRFDPVAASARHEAIEKRLSDGYDEDDSILDDLLKMPPGHIPHCSSAVDILICTPGRLVDHIRSSSGFSLRFVEYLIIDEADELLNDSFQEWVDVILGALNNGSSNAHPSKVQKVILSATMTRDLSKLGSLKMRRPTLMAVTGSNRTNELHQVESNADLSGAVELPPYLTETAVPVGDGTEKPLYLLSLLLSLFNSPNNTTYDKPKLSSLDNQSSTLREEGDGDRRPSNSLQLSTTLILVFTNNNEDAMRLSHLLKTLHPDFAPAIGTLTKTSSTDGRRTLASFKSRRINILIASDRASRGLDVDDLAHVISYDMPRNITSYIHRIGRTARAGKPGNAYTFYSNDEARWFWNSIARSTEINRSLGKVGRLNIDLGNLGDDKRARYDESLRTLQSAVLGTE